MFSWAPVLICFSDVKRLHRDRNSTCYPSDSRGLFVKYLNTRTETKDPDSCRNLSSICLSDTSCYANVIGGSDSLCTLHSRSLSYSYGVLTILPLNGRAYVKTDCTLGKLNEA